MIRCSFYGEGSSRRCSAPITANGLSFKVIGIVEPYTDNFSLAGMGQNGTEVQFPIVVGSNYDDFGWLRVLTGEK